MALHKDILKKSLPSSLPPHGFAKPRSGHGNRRKDYSPLPWNDFFDRSEDVRVGNNCFRVYLKGSGGPVLLLLHGGGHSALSWAVFSVAVSKVVQCRIAALDIRGHASQHIHLSIAGSKPWPMCRGYGTFYFIHRITASTGNTSTEDDGDLSATTLVSDVQAVTESLYGSETPPIVLMGHSMGGAIAIHVAAKLSIPTLVGLAVIDVVEGTAMDSLSANHSFLSNRPTSFKSLQHAIEWSVRSGQLRNLQSARVSVPEQVTKSDDKPSNSNTSIDNVLDPVHHSSGPTHHSPGPAGDLSAHHIPEEEEEEEEEEEKKDVYVWRIDLVKTEPYWKGWFSGLTKLFLSCPLPKILILAGVDRLDKEMTIAHMQGKFQMQVLSGCGHAVHEDVPEKVADIVSGYLIRHGFAETK